MKNIKIFKPITPSRRGMTGINYRATITKKEPEKGLVFGGKKFAGRSKGKVSVRHQGAGVKRLYRQVDFKQDKLDIEARVVSLEYDPGRSAFLALLFYQDGEKRYIIAPAKVKVGDSILSSKNKIEIKAGNRLPLKYIPVGTQIHNLELFPSKGGEVAKSAGSCSVVLAVEGEMAQIKMPSGEIRKFDTKVLASIGIVSNQEHSRIKIGSAGRKRRMGIRPTVRGKAMHPGAHPHGGGEGRSPVGLKYPKTPWGKHAKGVKTRQKKYSDRLILKRRK